jgi:hypothetical protein
LVCLLHVKGKFHKTSFLFNRPIELETEMKQALLINIQKFWRKSKNLIIILKITLLVSDTKIIKLQFFILIA